MVISVVLDNGDVQLACLYLALSVKVCNFVSFMIFCRIFVALQITRPSDGRVEYVFYLLTQKNVTLGHTYLQTGCPIFPFRCLDRLAKSVKDSTSAFFHPKN